MMLLILSLGSLCLHINRVLMDQLVVLGFLLQDWPVEECLVLELNDTCTVFGIQNVLKFVVCIIQSRIEATLRVNLVEGLGWIYTRHVAVAVANQVVPALAFVEKLTTSFLEAEQFQLGLLVVVILINQ